MTGLIRAGPLRLAAGVFATALAFAGAQQAEAQSVFFSGYTAGCFGTNCTPTTPTATLGGLTYTASGTPPGGHPANSGFYGYTADGFLAIGGPGNNFGTFALTSSNFAYTGQSFSLLITFVDPSSNNNLFTASLLGTVTVNGAGGVSICGPNSTVTQCNSLGTQFWADANGTYSVTVNPVSVFPGQSGVPVTGHITAAVPEPITMLLMGTGLAGVGMARRRRMRATQADLI